MPSPLNLADVPPFRLFPGQKTLISHTKRCSHSVHPKVAFPNRAATPPLRSRPASSLENHTEANPERAPLIAKSTAPHSHLRCLPHARAPPHSPLMTLVLSPPPRRRAARPLTALAPSMLQPITSPPCSPKLPGCGNPHPYRLPTPGRHRPTQATILRPPSQPVGRLNRARPPPMPTPSQAQSQQTLSQRQGPPVDVPGPRTHRSPMPLRAVLAPPWPHQLTPDTLDFPHLLGTPVSSTKPNILSSPRPSIPAMGPIRLAVPARLPLRPRHGSPQTRKTPRPERHATPSPQPWSLNTRSFPYPSLRKLGSGLAILHPPGATGY